MVGSEASFLAAFAICVRISNSCSSGVSSSWASGASDPNPEEEEDAAVTDVG